jgi:hypothetical protein
MVSKARGKRRWLFEISEYLVLRSAADSAAAAVGAAAAAAEIDNEDKEETSTVLATVNGDVPGGFATQAPCDQS